MKKVIFGAAALAVLCCTASCGSHAVSNSGVKASAETFSNKSTDEIIDEVLGCWETSFVFLNGKETEPVSKRFTFETGGNGLYYAPDGEKQQISWEVTPLGGIRILYEEMGEIAESYSFIGCDLVCIADTDEGKRETHIARVPAFTQEQENLT